MKTYIKQMLQEARTNEKTRTDLNNRTDVRLTTNRHKTRTDLNDRTYVRLTTNKHKFQSITLYNEQASVTSFLISTVQPISVKNVKF